MKSQVRDRGRRNPTLLVVALLLAVSLGFAFLASYSPVKSLPTIPPCPADEGAKAGNVYVCMHILQEYAFVYKPMLLFGEDFPYWLFKSEVQVAEGFALVAVVLLLFQAKRLVPSVFRRALNFPRVVRDASLLTFLGGALVYSFFIVLNWLREEYGWPSYPAALGGVSGELRAFYALSPLALGEAAILSMVVAVAGLTIYRSNIGLWTSLRDAVTCFSAPAIMTLEVGLFIISPSEMPRNVTNVLPFRIFIYGVGFTSNWVVLMVSSGIFAIAMFNRLRGTR